MSDLLFVLLLITSLFSPSLSSENTGTTGFRASLRSIDSRSTFSRQELIARAVKRSNARAENLFSSSKVVTNPPNPVANVKILMRPSQGEYIMDLAIGSPPNPYSAIVDTGSDLIWTQCTPCVLCVEQPTPFFNPLASKTFSRLNCSSSLCQAVGPLCYQQSCVYIYGYSDGSSSTGVIANETFTFGTSKNNVSVPKIAFGCGNLNEGYLYNSSGMVGLGRGALSLVSQLGQKKFAYCLTYFFTYASSPLLFGSTINTNTTSITAPFQSTPFMINPERPSLYYVSLIGITVGKTRLSIPASTFAINVTDGSGGVIIDSGSSITYLQADAYYLMKLAFAAQVNLTMVTDNNYGLDICFPWPPAPNKNIQIPSLTLHFAGANMTLPLYNYMLYDPGFYCVAMLPSYDISIIGNYQQQNMYMIHDLENNKLSFAPAKCDLI